MEQSIFAYIRRHSWKQQLVILALTLLSFPPLYYSLELPKKIINEALGKPDKAHHFLGFELPALQYLFALCGVFLCLVLIGGVLKYVMNVFAGVVAERMLRRLRYDLYSLVLRFPLPHLRRVSQGELVQMINAETEALGGYVGDALAVPAFQGGTLITILFFMFMQDVVLGLAAVALYPVQAYLIPKLQWRVNNLGKQRVRQVRRNAERISETVMGVRDIRANATSSFERARFAEQLGFVYWIRFDIYKKKFLIKFINNFMAQLGPFFFFTIGGYLVLQGQISLGALVAVVAAQKDLAAPWKELLTYYQTMYDVKIKYEQTVAQFDPPGLVPPINDAAGPDPGFSFEGTLRAAHLTLADDGDTRLDAINFAIDLPARIAVTGPAGSGKEDLTLVLAGLVEPSAGRVTVGEADLTHAPPNVLGRHVAYVGSPPYVFAGSLADNLLYGLKYRPLSPAESDSAEGRRERLEAHRSGNTPFRPEDAWIDLEAAGVRSPGDQLAALVRALRVATFEQDVYVLGLRGTAGDRHGDLPQRLLEVRQAMQRELASQERLKRLVEPFDPERFNSNATVAENLLFGAPRGPTFHTDRIATEPYVIKTLERAGLVDELRRVGLEVARTMVELFADLPPDHEYFRQFSFIAPEDLPDYQALIARADPERLGAMERADRDRLLALPFKLVPARHRLGVLTPEHEAKILQARRLFRDGLPEALAGAIAFFEPDAYNQPSSIQDNIIFGKIAYGQAQAQARVTELLTSVLDEHGLRERVIDVGLDTECGAAGGRLAAAQRQKLAIARAVLRRPDMIVLYDATTAMDAQEQVKVRDALLEEFDGRTVVWSLPVGDWASLFDHVLALDAGRLAGTDEGPDDAAARAPAEPAPGRPRPASLPAE